MNRFLVMMVLGVLAVQAQAIPVIPASGGGSVKVKNTFDCTEEAFTEAKLLAKAQAVSHAEEVCNDMVIEVGQAFIRKQCVPSIFPDIYYARVTLNANFICGE